MKKIVLIEASPKIGEESTSGYLIKLAEKYLGSYGADKTLISVRQSLRKKNNDEDFESISNAEALIIAFPLYIYCLPGLLMRYLQDYLQYYKKKETASRHPRVYAVVNCGFPEPGINLEAVRVIRSFSRSIGAEFRFGVMIGKGGMVLNVKDAPFMKNKLDKVFESIAEDIFRGSKEEKQNIIIDLSFPRWLYFFMGNRNWFSLARKNGLRKKDLYRQPY